jgi:acetyltransferase-like isoleucine patch superfamily enzyme
VPDALSGSRLAVQLRRLLMPQSVVSIVAWFRWKAQISPRAEVELSPNLHLGRGTTISSFTKLKSIDGAFRTGRDCGFATGCFLVSGPGGVEIGDDVVFGPNVALIGVNYRYARVDVPLQQQGVTSLGIRIGRNVWVGANSTILDGSVLGDNSIVVANSLVNRRFPPNVIIQGNPAKVILRRQAAVSSEDAE